MDTKLGKLKNILEILNDGISKSDFNSAFQALFKFVQNADQSWRATVDEIKGLHSQTLTEIKLNNQRISDIEKTANGIVSSSLNSLVKKIDDKLTTVQDGKPADEVKIVSEVLSKIPSVDIQPLRDEITILTQTITELKKTKSDNRPIFGGAKTKIYIVDLSSQLDGTTKTFNLGFTHFGIVGVFSSSSPFPFRPTIDYTESDKSIIFTSAVDASVSLAAGQTVIVQVMK